MPIISNLSSSGSINNGSNNIQQRSAMPQPGAPPRPQQPNPQYYVRTIYSQKTTKNKSFLDMHHYLKSIGVSNNEFMLALLDPDLDGIDPHDPNLNSYYKTKILKECLCNYW